MSKKFKYKAKSGDDTVYTYHSIDKNLGEITFISKDGEYVSNFITPLLMECAILENDIEILPESNDEDYLSLFDEVINVCEGNLTIKLYQDGYEVDLPLFKINKFFKKCDLHELEKFLHTISHFYSFLKEAWV